MATFRGTAPELLERRLRRVFFNEYRMQPTIYTQIANVSSNAEAFIDTIRVAGLGSLVLKPEGMPIVYDDPVQGARKRVLHQTYALGFRVTMEMRDDEQYGIIDKMPKDLGDATRDHRETLFFDIFNDAFAGNRHTGLEAEALCITTHTLLKTGGTASNALSPGVALSVSGLESMWTNFALTVNDSGRFVQLRPSQLLIHPNESHNAHQLLNTEKEPFTTENQVSTVSSSRLGISPVESPYLTDTDAYFMLARKSDHTLQYVNRMASTFDRNKDASTKDSLFDTMYRSLVTFDEWRGVVGSQP